MTTPQAKITVTTPPAVEPVTVGDLKAHLRLASGDIATDLTPTTTVTNGTQPVGVTTGATVEILGQPSLAVLNAGTATATGSAEVKLQQSNDDATWADVPSGTIATITTANDNAVHTLAYTGTYRYIRAVVTVTTDTVDLAVQITIDNPQAADDDYLTALITAAREHVTTHIGRDLITTTYDLYYDDWPTDDVLTLPYPGLSDLTSVNYTPDGGVETLLDSALYTADKYSIPSRVVLAPNATWPTDTLTTANAIRVTADFGYGPAASDVPRPIRQALLILAGHWYDERAVARFGRAVTEVPYGVDSLLAPYRVLP